MITRSFIGLFIMISNCTLFCQNPIEQIVKSYNNNNLERATTLIEKYELKYKKSEQWDSLVLVLNKKAISYKRIDGNAKALSIIQNALDLASFHYDNSHPIYLNSLLIKSRICMDAGSFKEADKNYNYIIRTANLIADTTGIKERAKINLAFSNLYKSEFKTAFNAAKVLEPIFIEQKDTLSIIYSYQILAYVSTYYGDLEDALSYYLKGLHFTSSKFGSHHVNSGIINSSLASIYDDLGKTNLALKYYNESKDILYKEYKRTGQSDYFASVIGNQGILYSRLGERALAKEYLSLALALMLENYGKYDYNLLWYYEALIDISIHGGNYDDAKFYINEANLLISNSESTIYDRAFINSYSASINYYLGQYSIAINKAMEIYNSFVQLEELYTLDGAHITNLMVNSYLKLDDPISALEWSEINYKITDSLFVESHSEYLLHQNARLEIYIALKDSIQIENTKNQIYINKNNGSKEYKLSHCIPDKRLMDFLVMWSNHLFDKIKRSKIDKQKYFDFLTEFEAYYEMHLSTIRTNGTIAEYVDDLKQIYLPAIYFSIEKSPEKALLYTEKIKAFVTRLILQNHLIPNNEIEDNPSDKLRTALLNLQDSSKYELFIETGDAIEKHQKYKDSIYNSDINLYKKQFGFTNISFDQIKECLHKDEFVVEYLRCDSLLYILYSNGYSTASEIRSFNTIQQLANDYRKERSITIARQLYKLLIPNSLQKNKNDLLIVPDDILFYLNFEELINDKKEYLIHERSVRYAYSTSVLSQQSSLSKKDRSTNNILAITPGFSNELKSKYKEDSSLQEIDTSWFYFIQQPFLVQLASNLLSKQNESISYTDQNASESNYKSLATDYKIIHLGTHGLLDDESPLFSKLIFAKDNNEDGYLHTYEIYGQNLNADLAVLSACNSGNGQLSTGEGVLSMAYAFTQAGCPSILMTLWDVDERSTAQILEKFYTYLLNGEQKSSALRKAKLDFLNEAPTILKDPYYWAGLVLIGDDNPLYDASSTFHWILVFLLFIVTLIIIASIHKRK